MNFEKVILGFFVFLALALNVVFVVGDIGNTAHHNVWILTIGILANLIAAGLKLGDRSQLGGVRLSSLLVANLLLISARLVWVAEGDTGGADMLSDQMALIVALAYGALMANLITALTLTTDTLMSRR